MIVMAYGTPRTPDDVEPYYTHIRRGRPPTSELLADLRRRYDALGGVSPLAERTEAQRSAIERRLDELSPGRYRVVLGQKHAAPFIEDAVAGLADVGVSRTIGLVLAPHYSAFSVGQYHERARSAGERCGIGHVGIDRWHMEPAYLDFLTGAVREARATLEGDRAQGGVHRAQPPGAGAGRRPVPRRAPAERFRGGHPAQG